MSLGTWLSISPNKMSVLQKELISRVYSNFYPIYLVNEYPKSGGTWLKFMLSEILGLPAWTKGAPVWGSCVMQAHWLKQRGDCKTVVLFRDGRDVMVSYYYHSFFRNEFQNGNYRNFMRDKFQFDNYEDIQVNLLPFMKEVIDNPLSPGFSWIDFVDSWSVRDDVVVCRYEDLRTNGVKELIRLKKELVGEQLEVSQAKEIFERFSMENMRKYKKNLNPGVVNLVSPEKSFIRKGSVGGWSECFTDEALDWFESRAGNQLEFLGYQLGRSNTKEKTSE